MNLDAPVYSADEFQRESEYLETLLWEAIAVQPGSKVLFCGYGPEGRHVERAVREGAKVTVIEHRNEQINAFANLGATLLRGSTSVIPARDASFDLAISFHYLHEIDPFFHAQVLFELSRVAKRVALIEPAPPADPLGKRIALLYSQAKRELGQFEYYQPLEYWKKLLQSVKADVSQHVFAFAKVPPREYLLDTIELLIDTIEVEEAPRPYIDDLRQIAKRSDAQLLPPPRYVLVGAAAGELIPPSFTQRTVSPIVARPSAMPPAAATVANAQPATAPLISPETGYEFPPIDPPLERPTATFVPQPEPTAFTDDPGFGAGEPAPGFSPGLPFGAPVPPDAASVPPPQPYPFGGPFATQGDATAFGVPPEGVPPDSSWEWEPPEPPAT
ncbi:MAG: class I SAM-dependent methyltransferase [Vulcanimicrobiaceae bacterium]